MRAAEYAQGVPFADYVAIANAETLVTVHIETEAAVNHLSEIVGVDGLDVIFIGPTDLSNSLGVPGQLQHPKVQAIVQRIVDTVAPTGLALGIMASNAEAARQWRDRGARYIAVGLENLMNPSCRNYLKTARDTP